MPLISGGATHKRKRGGAASGGRGRRPQTRGAGLIGGARKKTKKGKIPPQLSEWLSFAAEHRAKYPGISLHEISKEYKLYKQGHHVGAGRRRAVRRY